MKFTPRPKQIDYVLEGHRSERGTSSQQIYGKFRNMFPPRSRRVHHRRKSEGQREVVTELGTKITRNDVVEYDGKVVTPERKCYVLLNKPKDCVTTNDDPNGRTTVLDIVKGACQGAHLSRGTP